MAVFSDTLQSSLTALYQECPKFTHEEKRVLIGEMLCLVAQYYHGEPAPILLTEQPEHKMPAFNETVHTNLKVLQDESRTLSVDEKQALAGDILFRVSQFYYGQRVVAKGLKAAHTTNQFPPEYHASFTYGITGMFNGTKDGEEAIVDYSNGKSNINPPAETHIKVYDVRTFKNKPTFGVNGYQLAKHATQMKPEEFSAGNDPEGKRIIEERYYPEIKELVEKVTGASLVKAHNFRIRKQYEKPSDYVASRKIIDSALPLAHTDRDETTMASGIRHVFGDEEGERLMRKYRRWSQVNVWRGIGKTVDRWPLMMIDTDSIPGGFQYSKHLARIHAANDPRVATRGKKDHDVVLKDDPNYKYRYVSRQEQDEVWIFSSVDSNPNLVAPHGGFWDNATPDDTTARTSIEARTWAFFDPVDEE